MRLFPAPALLIIPYSGRTPCFGEFPAPARISVPAPTVSLFRGSFGKRKMAGGFRVLHLVRPFLAFLPEVQSADPGIPFRKKVCCSCILQGTSERVYLNAPKDGTAKTFDIIRILFTYGISLAICTVENRPCLTRTVEEAARWLLNEMATSSIKEFDCEDVSVGSGNVFTTNGASEGKQLPQLYTITKQGDWICVKCNFLNFSKNIKCLHCEGLSQEKMKMFKEEYEHLPIKKGDWICDRCNFLNFAKNTKCLQCNDRPTWRELQPGEWECLSCNYINFRRNAFCLKCGWKRPKALRQGCSSATYQHGRGFHPETSRVSFIKREGDNKQYHVQLESEVEDGDFWSTSDDEQMYSNSYISQHRLNTVRDQAGAAKAGRGLGKGTKVAISAMTSKKSGPPKFNESFSDEEMAEWFGHQMKDIGQK